MKVRGSDLEHSAGLSLSQLDLLRVVAQELKLPLTHISNTASMLADGDYNDLDVPAQHSQLELMSRRMIQIVDSVLYAGQIESQQISLQLAPTNVASVAHSVVVDLRKIAKLYDKEINLSITQALSPAAVDPVAVRHCLYGLIDTLIRTSSDSNIDVLVHHQTDSIMVTMRSGGQGFTIATIKEAINRFGRAAQPIKQLPNTTGMSFFVANTLSSAMNGRFLISQSADKRNLSIKLPLSQQLELVSTL